MSMHDFWMIALVLYSGPLAGLVFAVWNLIQAEKGKK